jgi:hypothetical protein
MIISCVRQRWALCRSLSTQWSFALLSPDECCRWAMAKDSPPRRILRWTNQNQRLPERVYLDRIYTDNHLQKLAHTEAESKSVEQLIDATLGRPTFVLSDDGGSPLQLRRRCVFGLVWIAP